MKILYVSNDSALGGASLSLLEILITMHRNHEVHVILPSEGELSSTLRKHEIPYHIVSLERDYFVNCNIDEVSKGILIRNEYNTCKKLMKIIEDNEIDVVHTNSSVGNAGLYAAVMTGRPHVWHIRELITEHYGARYFDESVKKKLLGISDRIIAISRCVRERILQDWSVGSIVLYDGIDRENVPYAKFCPDSRNILIAGNITPDKGQLDVVKAIRLVKQRGFDDVMLHIAGRASSKYVWAIKKYIEQHKLEKNVVIHPFQSDLSDLREKCLCSVTASKFEALGRVAVETMLSGRIPVGADTGATPEIIGTDGTRGLLYKYGDAESLANQTVSLFTMDDASKMKMISCAHEYAKCNFDIQKHCSDLLNIYNDCIKNYNKKKNDENRKLLMELFSGQDRQNICLSVPAGVEKKETVKGKLNLLEYAGSNIVAWLKNEGICNVAIYGMGNCGVKVYNILEHSGIKISFVMDQDPGFIREVCRVLPATDDSVDIDAVIVCILQNEQDIINSLRKIRKERIIGISQMIGYNG